MSPTSAPTHGPPTRAAPAGPLVPDGGTRSWTLWSPGGPVDVDVDAPDSSTLGEVLAALSPVLGLPAGSLWCGSSPLPPATPLSAAPLRHGAALGVDRAGPPTGDRDTEAPGRVGDGALELHVVGGPDAGRVAPLRQGDLVIGRGAAGRLPLTDPDVSRRHLQVGVRAGRVTVADLGSSNGSELRTSTGTSRLGTAPVPWPVGGVVSVGASAVRLTGPSGVPLDCRPAPAGRVRVSPVPAPGRAAPEVVVPFPAAPAERPRRRLGWVAVAVPAVAGLLMAWVLATPQFLFFALLGPVVAVGGWLSDRVSGRRDRRRSSSDHRAAQEAAETRLTAALARAAADLDEAHPDPAALVVAARRRSSPLWSRTGTGRGPVVVRLGLGPGPTSVLRSAADGAREVVTAASVPVTVDLAASGGLGLVGPRAPTAGVLRGLLLQLTTLVPPGLLRVVVAASAGHAADWRWTTWLPHVAGFAVGGDGDRTDDLDAALLALLAESATTEPGASPVAARPVTVVVLDAPVGPETAAALTAADDVLCLALAESRSRLAVPAAATVTVTGETGSLGRLWRRGQATDRELVLDPVPETVAADAARSLAPLAPPAVSGGLPDSCRLRDVPAEGLRVDPAVGAVSGSWRRGRGELLCVLGEDTSGPVTLDLCAQGPHALVAGTTGAGKSELLQTLVTSLALHQPPDRVSFLLVDYKGGAAFADTAALPHTVGLLTDLDSRSTERALRSLVAELTRRERVLAGHGVRDVTELAADVALPRLVIVVDEFATLAEELPGFVSGLVGMAQRGRSLGVHLVLATQRPSGVVSPEIRANCSLRICLRTTDETDSRDVLGSPLAAFLPVRRPGRAYLRAGSAAPRLFQVARVAGGPGRRTAGVRVRRRSWPPAPAPDTTAPADPATGRARPAGELADVVAALRIRAAAEGLDLPPRPWLPPLTDRLRAEDLDPGDGGRPADTALAIGLLDSPDTQRQRPLVLDLAVGGGWLVVGGPRSGRTTALRTVLREAVHRLPPGRLQVHVLDGGGGGLAAEAARLAHTGTAVGQDDPYRSERLVARLQDAVDRRRADGPSGGPHLLLLVDGWEGLAAQLDEMDPGGGSSGFLRLLRDGAAAGLTCVVTADRAVPGSRLAAAACTRLVLPLPDRADYAVAGVPPRAVPSTRPPGRAVVGEDAEECQLALPREWGDSGSGPATDPAGPATADPAISTADPAISIVTLPADPVLDLAEAGGGSGGLWLAIGPGDDDGRTIGVDLLRSGGLLVVGPPGSGRTSALRAFTARCRHAGARVLQLGGPGSGRTARPDPDRPGNADGATADVGDVEALHVWAAAAGRPSVVVADNVTALPDAMADAVASLAGPGRELLVLASGGAPDLAGAFRGPTVTLRRSRTALLLRPTAADGQLLGIRLPRTPLPPRPGSGWLVTGGSARRVQVARHRVAGAAPGRAAAGPVDPADVG
ncbi:FtsK/SpoIIIE domain-containing protein [Modestobacter sp. URMC 112]